MEKIKVTRNANHKRRIPSWAWAMRQLTRDTARAKYYARNLKLGATRIA